MKWNASLAAALSLVLAACGTGRGYDYAPETAPPPRGSVAAQSWEGPSGPPPYSQDRESETWRAADGSIRTRAPSVPPEAPQIAAQPEDAGAPYPYPGPGTSDAELAYAWSAPVRERGYRQRGDAAPQPRPQLEYAPAPQADPSADIDGPRGSSQPQAGERRYDEIGYAGIRGVSGGGSADDAVVAVHPTLAPGSVVEVTALETGRTILVLVTGTTPPGDRAIDLSPGAVRQLGYGGSEPLAVRVRRVVAGPQDVALLRAGQPATSRPDTPPVLLNALRKRLPVAMAAAPAPAPSRPVVAPVRPAAAPVRPRPAPAPPRPVPAARGNFAVQVAALSNAGNAQSLAKRMGGFVKQGGGLHRVQLGPFVTRAEAERARAGAARAGHKDARVIAIN